MTNERLAVRSQEDPIEKKRRPQHSECEFCRDGLCVNVASMFYHEVRELDAHVCSSFRKRESEAK